MSSICGLKNGCNKDTQDWRKCLEKQNPADMMAKEVGPETTQQHLKFDFQERCWESRKGFETFDFRDDLDLNTSVVGEGVRNSRPCVGRK